MSIVMRLIQNLIQYTIWFFYLFIHLVDFVSSFWILTTEAEDDHFISSKIR